MEKNIFWLENDQLKEIASSFREKVEEGLKHENADDTYQNSGIARFLS